MGSLLELVSAKPSALVWVLVWVLVWALVSDLALALVWTLAQTVRRAHSTLCSMHSKSCSS